MGWTNYGVQVHDGDKLLPRKVIHQEFAHDALRVYCEHFGIERPRYSQGTAELFEEGYVVELEEVYGEDAELE